jgi:hypothetical protein
MWWRKIGLDLLDRLHWIFKKIVLPSRASQPNSPNHFPHLKIFIGCELAELR